MADKSELPTVYIGDTFTIDGKEVAISDTIGIENMGGVVGVVVTVLSDDVHVDPSAMSPSTRIVTGDDLYPAGRVNETIEYLKSTRAHVYARHVDTYGDMSDRMPNEVIDVIDEVLDGLGAPVVEAEEDEVRPWGSNEVIRTTEEDTGVPVYRADEVVLHLDGMSFVTDGVEDGWVDAAYIANLRIDVTTHVTRVWPIDDPDHRGAPLDEGDMYTEATVEWDTVIETGGYKVLERSVPVNTVRLDPGVTYDRFEYEVSENRKVVYTDLVTLQTREEYHDNKSKEDEDNGE